MEALAWWVVRPGEGELRAERLPSRPPPGCSLLAAACSGVSPGTERLVGLGKVPEECHARMAPRHMSGSFRLPVKYGYSWVGSGVAGALEGQRVFVMHPHQELALVEDHEALALPDDLPDERATLIPNMETAVNAVWDAGLSGEERCVVVGGGAVGLLVCRALDAGRSCALVEADPGRAAFAAGLPWVGGVHAPGGAPRGSFGVAFHCTGSGAGLQEALDLVGFEGLVVDVSWYGPEPVRLRLGGSFHFDRKRLLSSQVGAVAPSHRSAAGRAGRRARVLELLRDRALDRLPGPRVPFAGLPGFMAGLFRGAAHGPCPVVRYGARPPDGDMRPCRD